MNPNETLATTNKAILFFDDDLENIANVQNKCPDVFTVFIEPGEGKNYKEYIEEYQSNNNAHANAINMDLIDINDTISNSNSITESVINNLNLWIGKGNPNSDRYVFFDWDKTLTVVPGFDIVNNNMYGYYLTDFVKNYSNIKTGIDQKFESILKFSMGGEDRLEMIRAMLDNLFNNGIKVYIVTNNPFAQLNLDVNVKQLTANRPFFITLLKTLDDRFESKNLISSLDCGRCKGTAINKTVNPINDTKNNMFANIANNSEFDIPKIQTMSGNANNQQEDSSETPTVVEYIIDALCNCICPTNTEEKIDGGKKTKKTVKKRKQYKKGTAKKRKQYKKKSV